MIKPVLYLYEGGEPEDIIYGIKNIKIYIDKLYEEKYESPTKGDKTKIQGDCKET